MVNGLLLGVQQHVAKKLAGKFMQSLKSKLLQIFVFASLFVAQTAFANVVGSIIFKTGDVSVTHEDKSVIAAEKNLALNTGDTIETREGRVQFSLIDGGKVSLQPNSIFKINKYEFSGKEDGSEYAFMELIKGGLRTITGLIGHKNRERYQLKTTVATIGIRGTEFTVNFNDNQFLMTTNHGSVDVCGTGGNCLNAVTGQSIAISGVGGAPTFSNKKAKAAAAAPESSKAIFTASDAINIAETSATPTAIPNVVAAGVTVGNIVSLSLPATGGVSNEVFKSSAAVDSAGKLTTVINDTGTPRDIKPLSFASFNTDGIVSWGQAQGGSYVGNGSTNFTVAAYDYITGTTPNNGSLANLSGTTYNVFNSTAPFQIVSGAYSPVGTANTTSGFFTFDFSANTYNYSLNVLASSQTFTLAGNDNNLNANNPSFSNIGSVTSAACTAGSCSGALLGGNLIQGTFLGANGERIGLQYGISTVGGNIYGGAVLK